MQFAARYLWWALALLLIAAELVLPGYFMLWIGFAAAVMGLLLLLVPQLAEIWQAILFTLLTLVFCVGYWRWVRPRLKQVGRGTVLNRRSAGLIGQHYMLVEPIINGRGKVRVGDSLWLVSGPELAAGRNVRVIAVEGTTLKVQAAD
jgi:membrane protein implicated in regulation of membrane protease activity